jgi:hypothetical protein
MPLDNEIRIAREHHLHRLLSSSLTNRASVLISQDIPRALTDATESARNAKQTGFLDWTYVIDLNLANAQYLAGEWDGCLDTGAARGIPEDDEPGVAYYFVDVTMSLVLDARGLPVPIPPVWRYSEERFTFLDYDRVWPVFCTAIAAWYDGDHQAAMNHGDRVIDVMYSSSGFQDDFGLIWSTMVQRAIPCRCFEPARRWIALVESARPSRIEPVLRGLLPWLRGALNMADPGATALPGEIETDLRTAMSALDACGVVPQRALAAAGLGRLLIRLGRGDEARGLLLDAIQTMTHLGATRWLDDIGEFAPDLLNDSGAISGS